MAIQKFIVNGDEAKIDYEGLENKPFGNVEQEELIYPLKSSNYTNVPQGMAMAQLDPSDLTGPLVSGKRYIVEFDETDYEVTAESMEGATFLSDVPFSELTSSNFTFMIQYVDMGGGQIMFAAWAQTEGDHSLSITKIDLSALDPVYLPSIYVSTMQDNSITTEEMDVVSALNALASAADAGEAGNIMFSWINPNPN